LENQFETEGKGNYGLRGVLRKIKINHSRSGITSREGKGKKSKLGETDLSKEVNAPKIRGQWRKGEGAKGMYGQTTGKKGVMDTNSRGGKEVFNYSKPRRKRM